MGKKTKHESFGQMKFIRQTSNSGVPLYGSSIKHKDIIEITISESELERGLNTDWYYASKPIVKAVMSQSQFAEAITSMNIGGGVPVTLTYTQKDGTIKNTPFEGKVEQFEEEFSSAMKGVTKKVMDGYERVHEILSAKKAPSKSEREEIINIMGSIKINLESNVPFVYSSFNEQMDKTIKEAKGEVEAFVQNKVNSLGIKGLKAEMLMIEGEKIVIAAATLRFSIKSMIEMQEETKRSDGTMTIDELGDTRRMLKW